MFAVRSAIQRNSIVLRRTGRWASTAAAGSPVHIQAAWTKHLRPGAVIPKAPIPEMYQQVNWIKRDWLSDPSTYPLMIAMSSALCFIVGFTANAFYHYKDIRINPDHKHQTLQSWGKEHYDSIPQKVARKPITSFHSQLYRDIQYEGLGVDHEAWLKRKATEQSK